MGGELKSMVDIILSCISGFIFIGARWKTIFLRIEKNVCDMLVAAIRNGCGDTSRISANFIWGKKNSIKMSKILENVRFWYLYY